MNIMPLQTDIEDLQPMNAQTEIVPSLAELQNMPVHPMAAIFPMLAEDELQELASDIKENGQKEPIVIGDFTDAEGEVFKALIDGRNRLAACVIAGVQPLVRVLDGTDHSGFILSVNVNRRHMTAGQRAMARAMLKPEGERGKRSDLSQIDDKLSRGEVNQVSRARFILRHDEQLAQSVINGSISLNEAYNATKERVEEQERDEEQHRSAEEQRRASLDALRNRYPDLARRVEEDGIGIKAMLVEADERDAKAKSQRQSLFMGLRNARSALAGFAASSELPKLPEYLKSKELKAEFVDVFRDEPTVLTSMVETMEAEVAALKAVIELIGKD